MRRTRDLEELDRALDRVVAGDAGAHPVAAYVRVGLMREVAPETLERHLSSMTLEARRPAVVQVAVPGRRATRVRIATAGLATAVLVALGASSAIAAADAALPGQPLYGLKRAVERMGLAMHRGESSRAEVHLRLAARRLAEIQALLAAGQTAASVYGDYEAALAAAESHTLAAESLGLDLGALLDHVEDAISKHVDRLSDLLTQVPAEARDAIQHAIDRASQTQERVLKGRSGEHGKPSGPGRPTSPGSSGSTPGR